MDITPFVKIIEKQKLNCEGVVVFQHREKIAEYRWIPETPKSCYSVSKSFTSIAIGMALEQGKLSLGDRVLDAFPGVIRQPGERLVSLALEHLLTMTRGYGGFSRPATVVEALEQELKYEPGSRFVYDNGSTLLASAMFTQALGKTVRDFLVDALFRPLGIPDPEWAESADGHTMGATGLLLSTSSLALFGQLLLQRGQWNGRQLVPPLWIDCASRSHVSTSDSRHADCDLGYGYGFWPCRHGAYRADGKDGQFVVVLPRQDAVVAINSNEKKHYPVLYAVWDAILPAL
ncbi:penicillin-binding protein [Spirochaetia bacterium]|nr:penicillin-binding protein [Spirochaetia bacterium]